MAESGSFSTPFFGQPFDEKIFHCDFDIKAIISMPKILEKSAKVVIEIDYDITSIENIEVSAKHYTSSSVASSWALGGSGNSFSKYESEKLSTAKRFVRRTFFSYYILTVNVHFTRHMSNEECRNWPARRNTGFNISWYHLDTEKVQPRYPYLEQNQYYITLANVIHEQQGVSEDMTELMQSIEEEKKTDDSCEKGSVASPIRNMISEMYGNVSRLPIHADVITEETLDIADKIYFGIAFCPNFDQGTVEFYEKLFRHFSLETNSEDSG